MRASSYHLTCTSYQVETANPYPPLDETFAERLTEAALGTSDFGGLFANHGTHYLHQFDMGARSGQMSYFTETEYSEVVEDCSSMSLAAEYSGNVKFGLEASADTCKSGSTDTYNQASVKEVFSVGTALTGRQY